MPIPRDNSVAAFEHLPIGVLGLSPGWRIQSANPAAHRALRAAPGELIDRELADLFDDGHTAVDRLAAGVSMGQSPIASARLAQTSDPEPSVVDLLAAPGSPELDDAPAFLVAVIDVSDRSRAQRETERLRQSLAESERARTRMDTLQRELASSTTGGMPRIIGASAPMLVMMQHIERVAPTSATVLIRGESGSGKELVARAIHAGSPRAARALIAVNCAAMPETLLESELFGHERGAFTGADRQRLGKFELADGGTLFLDEIGELSPSAQAKLLRVLQEGTFERVGGAETIRVDVRLVTATHRDLPHLVQRGRFREDLFYRLNVFSLTVPALRDRKEDLRALIEHLHERHARRMARPVLPISERSMRRVLTYRWPGNVRELENAVERATLLATGPELEIDLPEGPGMTAAGTGSGPDSASGSGSGGSGGRDTSKLPRDVLLDLSLDQLQRLQVMHALEVCRYRVFGEGGAAEKLGINPQTLLSRMDKLGIPRPRAMRAALKADNA